MAAATLAAAAEPDLLDPEHWRRQGVEQLAPLWLEHAPDPEFGGFHAALGPDWKPTSPTDKLTAMQSREVFGLCAAYLLSGDERYFEAAERGAQFVLDHGWDAEHGGWYDKLSRDGRPIEQTKSIQLQLYTNVGLAMWAFVSGDPEALSRVHTSVEIGRRHGWDPIHGGYVQQLNRELGVADWGKNKHAHYGYVGSLLLNLYLTDRRPETLALSRELTDLSLERMRGPEGWVYGFHSKFDRQWRLTPELVDGREAAATGAQLTAALSFLRLAQQTGEDKYRQAGLELGRRITAAAMNSDSGAWIDEVAVQPPHQPLGQSKVHWWIQIYGAFLQLHLYQATGDKQHLQRFEQAERFFDRHFLDRALGGVFAATKVSGEPIGKLHKAGPWDTAYHEMEHSLLNYVYLSLYVHRRPVELHFRLDGPGEFPISLADTPDIRIKSVQRNGDPWREFDAARRTVRLPKGLDQRIVVKLGL